MKNFKNKVVWITGVSASGKTTLAYNLNDLLPHSIVIDADVVRKNLWPELGLGVKDRAQNVMRIALLGNLICSSLSYGTVIIACIAPNSVVRDQAISLLKQKHNVFLVYLHCSLEERINRDPKGLYRKAINGEIKDLTGYDGQYDEPHNADFIFDSGLWSSKQLAYAIMKEIK